MYGCSSNNKGKIIMVYYTLFGHLMFGDDHVVSLNTGEGPWVVDWWSSLDVCVKGAGVTGYNMDSLSMS